MIRAKLQRICKSAKCVWIASLLLGSTYALASTSSMESIASTSSMESIASASPIESIAFTSPMKSSASTSPMESIAFTSPIDSSVSTSPMDSSVSASSIESIAFTSPMKSSASTSSMESIASIPIRLPVHHAMEAKIVDTFNAMFMDRKLPTIELPDKKAGNSFFDRLLSKNKLELSLEKSKECVLYSGDEPEFEVQKADFPQVEVLPTKMSLISFSDVSCERKHLFDNEAYPDFSPFGQGWLKDPLSAFPFYREQLTTKSMINPNERYSEDTFLGSFLQSSIVKLEQALDDATIASTQFEVAKITCTNLMNLNVKEVADLREQSHLKDSFDLYHTINFIEMPLLTSFNQLESKNVLPEVCYTDKIESITLQNSPESLCAWKDNFMSEFLQVLENRQTTALFNSPSYLEAISVSPACEILGMLLTRISEVRPLIDETVLAKQISWEIQSSTDLSGDQMLYVAHSAIETPQEVEINLNKAEYKACKLLSFDPATIREFGLQTYKEKVLSDSLPTFTSDIKLAIDSIDTSSQNTYFFEGDRDEMYSLFLSPNINFYPTSFTLAGVYCDEFFAPVESRAYKKKVKTQNLPVQIVFSLLGPYREKIYTSSQLVDGLPRVESSELKGCDPSQFSLKVGQFLSESTLATSSFGLATSPFFEISYLPTDHNEALSVFVSPACEFDDPTLYFRQPFAQDYNTYQADAFENVDKLFELEKVVMGQTRFDSIDQNDVAQFIVLQDALYSNKELLGTIYTNSFSHDEINQCTGNMLVSTTSHSFEIPDFALIPYSEVQRFDVNLQGNVILSDFALDIDTKVSGSLYVLESMEKNMFDDFNSECASVECLEPNIGLRRMVSDFSNQHLPACKVQRVEKENYSMFARLVDFDQERALLSYHADIEESMPEGYFQLPHLELTEAVFLSLSSSQLNLLETTPFSQRAAIREFARGTNQSSRFTHLGLSAIPSLEFLQTDSLEDEFTIAVRTIPKKTGNGYLFSLLLSPADKQNIDLARNHVYYLIDRSSSIEEHRFLTFKKALAQSLNYLDEGTPFNIATFDYDVNWLSEDDMSASKRSLKHVRKLIDDVSQRGKSNLQAFVNVIETIKGRAEKTGEPHTVILLSDGRFLKNLRVQRQLLKSLTSDIPDTFALFAASTSDNNNIAMLNLITGLCRGDAVHSRTHSSYSRKLASLTRRVKSSIGFSTKITKIDNNGQSFLFENMEYSKQIYAGKIFKIYGETHDKKDLNIMIQAYNGQRYINIPKVISFKNADHSPSRLEKDLARETTIPDFIRYIQTGNSEFLLRANKELTAQNMPLPAR